ncbi:MAG: DUF4189 domain-containing protein [Rhodanobacter sp.]|jgi:hypothetical protein
MKVLCLLVLLLTTSALHAQAACPPGTIPYGTGNDPSACGPDNSQPDQLQQPRAPRRPPQVWANHWGAIATNEPTGSLGIANNMSSQNEAERTALADCQSKHGSTCKIETSYRNGCGALIGSTTGYVVTSKATLDETVQAGMLACTKAEYSNCHVYYSACSLPERIQ